MMRWSGYRDPAARRAAAADAERPPLPLTQRQALEHALHLRTLGLNGRAISIVLGHYHGHWAPPATWYGRMNREARRERSTPMG